MDIKKYALFADIAQTGNFTKSGNRMGYTQSGVSHILKSLEDEMGFSLFIRTKQGVKLTKNAEAILPLVRSLLATNENLEQTINSLNSLQSGRLTIASFSSISIHWLPQIIKRYNQLYPDVQITLMEGGTDDIVDWVSNDVADFGFMSKRHIKSLEWIDLIEDPLVAVLPKDYETSSDVFNISDFEGKPFIISASGTDYDIRHALTKSGVEPNIRYTSRDDNAIISLVANKLGVTLLPELIIKDREDQVLSLPVEPYCSRKLGVAVKSKKNMNPASRKFVDVAKQVLSDLDK